MSLLKSIVDIHYDFWEFEVSNFIVGNRVKLNSHNKSNGRIGTVISIGKKIKVKYDLGYIRYNNKRNLVRI